MTQFDYVGRGSTMEKQSVVYTHQNLSQKSGCKCGGDGNVNVKLR